MEHCQPSLEQFLRHAETANLIPVYRELLADVETPVSALHKVGGGPGTYLLESVEGGESLGRYSFLGTGARVVCESRGGVCRVREGKRERSEPGDPLTALRRLLARYRPAPAPGLPRFWGGAVGYLGYDCVRYFERLPAGPPDDLEVPDAVFVVTDAVLIFDHVRRKLQVVANVPVEGDPAAAYRAATARIDELCQRLAAPLPLRPLASLPSGSPKELAYRANVTPEAYMEGVRRCKEYIRAGDAFQIVLSQRLSAPVRAEPPEVYRLLRTVNPSPYMFFLDLGGFQLVGSSPEVMVRLEDGKATLRPIAGTRPRGRTLEEDTALGEELRQDDKERAEHVMLVDLGRNDLGRVCRYGSVRVDRFMELERYSHVMHLVSNVVGELAPGRDALDLLRATFPAGTVSGAPKIRAMEIIDELEPTRRGPYAGAVGYVGFSGNMDSCITIRTVLMKDGYAHVQAGAGIVADSDPEREYQESLNKAGALLKALALAEEVRAGAFGDRQLRLLHLQPGAVPGGAGR